MQANKSMVFVWELQWTCVRNVQMGSSSVTPGEKHKLAYGSLGVVSR